MKTNDETILKSGGQVINPATPQVDTTSTMVTSGSAPAKSGGVSWAKVVFGTTAGILMGAGAMYGSKAYGAETAEGGTKAQAAGGSGSGESEFVKVAKVSDTDSFTDAFNSARAQVGPGGVFRWHGGLYNTYKEEEWNAMSDADKADFAYAVRPEVRADEIVAERMSAEHPDVALKHEHTAAKHTESDEDSQNYDTTGHVKTGGSSSPRFMDEMEGSDVHVVSRGDFEGHEAAAVDVTGDGQADVVVIDVDNSGTLSDPDVVVTPDGNVATVNEIAQMAEGGQVDTGTPDTDPNMQQISYDGGATTPDDPAAYMGDDGMQSI